MGLAISVGELAFALSSKGDPEGAEYLSRSLERLNRCLVAEGLPPHEEPTVLPRIPQRGAMGSFPYSFTHHLRRAVAYARQAPEKFATIDREQNPTEDEYYDRELSVMMDCHLICHSDCEGFYVPIDFPAPLYPDDSLRIPGGIVGSSQRLLAELIHAAPLLEIELQDDSTLSDTEAARLSNERHRYHLERLVWFAYFVAASTSIEYGTVISFG